ncbi:Fimbrial protein precursor [compost metagenome]
MIVVAIVAILAAIALPAYQTYTKKAKFSEVVTATGAFKTAVEVCAQKDGSLANCAAEGVNGIPAAVSASTSADSFVQSVTIALSGSAAQITAVGKTPTPFESTENTYILEGNYDGGRVIWTNAASGSTCSAAGIC